MSTRSNRLNQVGRSIPGVDSRLKLSGAASYTTDVQIEGMLHAKMLRSTHAHALIKAIDVSAAASMDGVIAIATGHDLTTLDPYYGTFIRDQPVLAIGKVRYVGEPVAAVAAIDEATACRAVEAIRIAYSDIGSVMTMAEALAPDAPSLFDGVLHEHELPPPPINSRYQQEPAPNILFAYDYSVGDAEAWWSRCDRIVEQTFSLARISHFGLEPHIAIARTHGEQAVEVWCNNQDPFLLQRDIARIFRLPLGSVQLHGGFIGGGFGGKSYCKIEPIAVLLARKAGRPVRLALTMAESMLTVCEHGAEIHLRSGVSGSGETLVREASVLLDGGAYADASPSVAMRIGSRFNGAYRWKALRTVVKAVRTTTIPAGSFRGFGSAHVTWASESQMDVLAREIGMDPCEFRRCNFTPLGVAGAPDETPIDCDLSEGLNAVTQRVGGKGDARIPGRGIGFAVAVKSAAGGHSGHARVRILPCGAARIATGVSEIGQSTRTVMTQVAAEVLGLMPEQVEVEDIDTLTTPFDSGTHASSGVAVSGIAMRDAAEIARDALLGFAAGVLGCPQRDLEFRDGKVIQAATAFTVADLLALGGEASPGEFTGASSKQTSGPFFWMPSWTAAEVEVDRETGVFKVLQLVNAVEVGTAINPQRCISQSEGAAVQGLGQALFEEISYADDMPLNAEPLKYRVSRSSDVPPSFETVLLEQGHGPGPFGAKGVGEAGNLTIPAAIANAIHDAVGARVTDLPITPERVLQAIKAVSIG